MSGQSQTTARMPVEKGPVGRFRWQCPLGDDAAYDRRQQCNPSRKEQPPAYDAQFNTGPTMECSQDRKAAADQQPDREMNDSGMDEGGYHCNQFGCAGPSYGQLRLSFPCEHRAVCTHQALISPVGSTLLLNSPSPQLCANMFFGPLSVRRYQQRIFIFYNDLIRF